MNQNGSVKNVAENIDFYRSRLVVSAGIGVNNFLEKKICMIFKTILQVDRF